MSINYSPTAFQHDSNVQKEFERFAKFSNDLEEKIDAIAKKVEDKEKEEEKKNEYAFTIKHNDEPLNVKKEVQVLNFIDTEKIKFSLENYSNNNPTEVSKPSTEISVQANAEDCLNALKGYLSLFLSRTSLSTKEEPKKDTYKVIKLDNPGDILGNKASEKGTAILTNNFPTYPISPTLSGTLNLTTYNLHQYRGLRYYNKSLSMGMGELDNSKGYTIVKVPSKGLYRVSCVMTAQWDFTDGIAPGLSIETNDQPSPAIFETETLVELMVMKNGLFNSLLNGMRIARRSFHLQGVDVLYCEANDEISIGFKASSIDYLTRREINLRIGGGTSRPDWTPFYSHLIIEKVSDDYQSYNNAGNTYSEEY